VQKAQEATPNFGGQFSLTKSQTRLHKSFQVTVPRTSYFPARPGRDRPFQARGESAIAVLVSAEDTEAAATRRSAPDCGREGSHPRRQRSDACRAGAVRESSPTRRPLCCPARGSLPDQSGSSLRLCGIHGRLDRRKSPCFAAIGAHLQHPDGAAPLRSGGSAGGFLGRGASDQCAQDHQAGH